MKIKYVTSTTFLLIAVFVAAAYSQAPKRYSHAAQKNLIPSELGKIYLGMPLKTFAAQFDITKAEANGQFRNVSAVIPVNKGNVISVYFKIESGDDEEGKALWLLPDKVTRKGEFGDYEDEISRIDIEKVPKGSFVYELVVEFDEGFDFRNYVIKKYGPSKDVHKPGEVSHIYDIQWFKKTADGLAWMIRFHENTRRLQLIGIIKGTEWSNDE